MTPEEFAAKITGRKHGKELTKKEESQAKEFGLIVVFGQASLDADLVQIRGSFHYDDLEEDDFFMSNPVKMNKHPGIRISVFYDDYDNYRVFKTKIPHATFDTYEDNEPFCRGIVFSVKELPGILG